MDVQQFDRESKGHFKALVDGKEAGIMTYSHAGPDKIIIDHTEVNPAFKGQGVGNQLLQALVAYVRENDKKVIPLCPFAKSVFDKTEAIRDVLV